MTTKKVLLKDIIIPKGTVLSQAPTQTVRDDTHFDCVMGLSKDTYGYFTYCFGDAGMGLDEYFADIKE